MFFVPASAPAPIERSYHHPLTSSKGSVWQHHRNRSIIAFCQPVQTSPPIYDEDGIQLSQDLYTSSKSIYVTGRTQLASPLYDPDLLQRRKLRDGGERRDWLMLNRILLSPSEVDHGNVAHLDKEDFRTQHIKRILNAKSGDSIRAGIVNSVMGQATIEWQNDQSLHMSLDRDSSTSTAPVDELQLDLMLAVPRPKVMLRILNAAATLGTKNIILCNAYRVEKSYMNSKTVMDPTTLQTELLSGLMQAGNDTRLPNLYIAARLQQFLVNELDSICGLPDETLRLVAHPYMLDNQRSSESLISVIQKYQPKRVLVAIGPEGGWMPREISMLCQNHRFVPFGMGDRILRSEQAVISSLFLAKELLSGLNE